MSAKISADEGEKNNGGHVGGPGKPNGCCCICLGAPPGPIDPAKIIADGGRYVTLPDSRILEYFVYGSTAPDATILLEFAGSFGTGRIFLEGEIPEMCRKLNIKGISITVPGHGYSTTNVGHRILDFAYDVDHVLQAEGVVQNAVVADHHEGEAVGGGEGGGGETTEQEKEKGKGEGGRKFLVEGTSYGSAHAMAVAWYYGRQGRVQGMHLHVPYLPIEISQAQEPKLAKAYALETSTEHLQRCSSCHNFCGVSCACCLIRMCGPCFTSCCAPSVPEYPAGGALAIEDMKRSAAHSSYGTVFNTAHDQVLQNWGFDIRDIPLKGPNKVLVSYALDDEDVPPEHGKWLGEYFDATVNAEERGLKHTTYFGKLFKGELVKQFYELTKTKKMEEETE